MPITHTEQQIDEIFVCKGSSSQETITWNWIEPRSDDPTSVRFLDEKKFSASAVCKYEMNDRHL